MLVDPREYDAFTDAVDVATEWVGDDVRQCKAGVWTRRVLELTWRYLSQHQGLHTDHHWRRQLWGTGARAPLDFPNPPPAKILREQIRKMYKKNGIFAQFLSIFGPFLSFFLPTVFLREYL